MSWYKREVILTNRSSVTKADTKKTQQNQSVHGDGDDDDDEGSLV